MNTQSFNSAAAAREAGAVKYNTGKPCRNGHFSDRYTRSTKCVECEKGRQRPDQIARYYAKRAEILEAKRLKRAEERGERNAKQREYRAKNPGMAKANTERARPYFKQYYAQNAERIKLSIRDWRAKNPGKVREYVGRARVARMLRVPAWLSDDDRARINMVYERAVDLTERTGTEHHVDHVLPLQGKTVSGLHVPENLQVMPASENLSKGNDLAIPRESNHGYQFSS